MHTTSPRLLIVDDEPAMRRSVERLLATRYDVRSAGSAREALEMAAEAAPDLAILDVRMPEVDGFALMSELRERHPQVDVIFMTGAIHEVDAQLIRAIRERAFYFIQKPFDRDVLLTLVARCLEQRRLSAENAGYTRRLEQELEDARSFQQSMLPPAQADFGAFSLAALYEPSAQLGGDLYDYAARDGDVSFVIADVSGHGAPAAMLTALVKSAFQEARVEDFAPTAVVTRVARALRPFDDARFVTLFCGHCSGDGGLLRYVNAGHPPPLVWGPTRARISLSLTGPMISPAFPDLTWDEAAVELYPGDRLLAYTDGITEMRGDEGLFGEERLLALVEGAESAPPALIEKVVAGVREFAGGRPPDDDLTLVACAYK